MGVKLNLKTTVLTLLLVTTCALGLLIAQPIGASWVLVAGLVFLGVLFFDDRGQLTSSWITTLSVGAIYASLVWALTEPSSEGFWRSTAGAVFFFGFLYEHNSPSWSGKNLFSSAFAPSLLFFVLVISQGAAVFSPEGSAVLNFSAVLVFALYELFIVFRDKGDYLSSSSISALRVGSCGIVTLFFGSTYMPSVIHMYPLNSISYLVPAMGLLLALASLAFSDVKRSYVFFTTSWNLFLLWAVLADEEYRLYAAILGAIAGAWSVAMANIDEGALEDFKSVYLKLSSWGFPGSFLFTAIVFILLPSQKPTVQLGSLIWAITFLTFWWGVIRMPWPKEGGTASWGWRRQVAVVVTMIGASGLAGATIFPGLFKAVWGGGV